MSSVQVIIVILLCLSCGNYLHVPKKEFTLHLTGSGKVPTVTLHCTYLVFTWIFLKYLHNSSKLFTGQASLYRPWESNYSQSSYYHAPYVGTIPICLKETMHAALYRQWKGTYGLTTVTFPAHLPFASGKQPSQWLQLFLAYEKVRLWKWQYLRFIILKVHGNVVETGCCIYFGQQHVDMPRVEIWDHTTYYLLTACLYNAIRSTITQ